MPYDSDYDTSFKSFGVFQMFPNVNMYQVSSETHTQTNPLCMQADLC